MASNKPKKMFSAGWKNIGLSKDKIVHPILAVQGRRVNRRVVNMLKKIQEMETCEPIEAFLCGTGLFDDSLELTPRGEFFKEYCTPYYIFCCNELEPFVQNKKWFKIRRALDEHFIPSDIRLEGVFRYQ